jgi:NAD(P)-dependent dehydrogenase (short-subunit alcohol dehydrogenase family)
VVGGTSGLGRAIANGFASAGATVVVGSSSDRRLAAAREEFGPDLVVRVDVTEEDSIRSAIGDAAAKLGRLDVVVVAAGIGHQKPTLDVELAEWQRVIEVNLTGAFLVSREAGRLMINQQPGSTGERGCLLHIASMGSFVGLAEVAAYGCSKAGIVALTKSLANDWARHGIRVNAIAPGFFLTDLNRARMEGTPRGRWVRDHTPMGRFGELDELVGAALYLCSGAASFTTGQVLIVDGGFLARGIGTP